MRSDWNSYFLEIAKVVATRSTCERRHVGAVLVRDKAILSTGYNGSVKGLEHCSDVGHSMEGGHCVRAVHAEENSVAQAAKNGTSTDGATLYVTTLPCWGCFKLVVNAGIKEIYYGEDYRPNKQTELAAQKLGIQLIKI